MGLKRNIPKQRRSTNVHLGSNVYSGLRQTSHDKTLMAVSPHPFYSAIFKAPSLTHKKLNKLFLSLLLSRKTFIH